MFLDYGFNDDGELIYIGQAGRGATALHCPYCAGLLTAKKGKIVTPHFAHTGETCRQVGRDNEVIALPAYDNFNLHLPGKVLESLHRFASESHGYSRHDLDLLERYELIQENTFNRDKGYDITHKGKIPLGQLSLDLFNKFQESAILARHDELMMTAQRLYQFPALKAEHDQLADLINRRAAPDMNAAYIRRNELITALATADEQRLGLDTALTDLRLYRAQWRRILSLSLYFLRINDGQYYKIGVTSRDIASRLTEITSDLVPLLGTVKIEVIGTWAHRGNVELYFKHRYQAASIGLGILTEYYQFEDEKGVVRDLRRMHDKTLTDIEATILSGQPSAIEETIQRDQIEAIQRASKMAQETYRRAMIKRGMKLAAKKGQHVGRPGQSVDEFLEKPTSQAIRAALESGLSIRQTAGKVGVSINTVQKVKRAMKS